MTIYSFGQLEQLWINNGGPRAAAPVAAAVALAESGGNSQATNPNDNNGTQTSWGLWQISNGTHNPPAANILDPNVNAKQAVGKYAGEGNSFSPAWGTYDSGAYRAYLSNATPDPNVPAAAPQGSGAQSANCLVGVNGLGINSCFFDKTQARALIGGVLVAGGLLMLALGTGFVLAVGLRRSGAGQTIIGLTPGGRALSGRAPAAPRRASAPGEDLTPDEVRRANANRRKLEAARKKAAKPKPPAAAGE